MNIGDRHGKGDSRRGGAAVEFALLLVFVFMPLTVAVIDLGQMIHAQYVITRAAREGVMASIRGRDAQAKVSDYINNAGLDSANALVTAPSPGAVSGSDATVTIVYDLTGMYLIPWDGVFSNLESVTASATGRQT